MKIFNVYFSPNKSVKKTVKAISNGIISGTGGSIDVIDIDITKKSNRDEELTFSKDDWVVFGVPVYAGRVPNILLKFFKKIKGNSAQTLAVIVYGNRHYDDALVELVDILEETGFIVYGGCAALGEHSFSKLLAPGRPDKEDLILLEKLGMLFQEKVISGKRFDTRLIPGNKPYGNYYQPKDKYGNNISFKEIKPITTDLCIDCKICFKVCPMESIDFFDVSNVGTCIKCCACVNQCPTGAKEFVDMGFMFHKTDLEEKFTTRKEIEVFI